MENDKQRLVVLTGPTAVGKTDLSLSLAKRIGGEIVSADSIQVYRGMDIGSAKIRPDQMQGIPHHLIDILDPTQAFDAASFQKMAKEAMEGIWQRGHIPILVGGTGFYIQGVLYDIHFTEHDTDHSIRRDLETIGSEPDGMSRLHAMLREADPESADRIPMQNLKRTIRALEFFRQTGQTMSAHNREERGRTSPYHFVYFVLNDDRSAIYNRIDRRVDRMMEEGLVKEVKGLLDQGVRRDMTSMQGLGYKEMAAYLEGDLSLEEAVYRIKRDSRHFAKRQLTWFRREKEVCWIDRQQYGGDRDRILAAMLDILQDKGIC